MTDIRELVQDLRAEAHRVPSDIAQLMRRAAQQLERRANLAPISLLDAEPTPAPFLPPCGDRESYEGEACS